VLTSDSENESERCSRHFMSIITFIMLPPVELNKFVSLNLVSL